MHVVEDDEEGGIHGEGGADESVGWEDESCHQVFEGSGEGVVAHDYDVGGAPAEFRVCFDDGAGDVGEVA